MNFHEANELLTGRCQQSRKIGNNTYLKRRGYNIAVMLHATDIITFRLSNTALLDSGGYRTKTTKERMNEYAPCNIVQHKGIWYIADWSTNNNRTIKNNPVYFDGIIIDCATGLPVGEPKSIDLKKHKKILNQCKEYAELVANSCPIEPPSNGDCLYCAEIIVGEKWKKETDHLLSHFKEKYIVPSLVYRACKQYGISQIAGSYLQHDADNCFADISKRQITSAVYRYLKMQFGIAS